jgi:hypothetical protein
MLITLLKKTLKFTPKLASTGHSMSTSSSIWTLSNVGAGSGKCVSRITWSKGVLKSRLDLLRVSADFTTSLSVRDKSVKHGTV